MAKKILIAVSAIIVLLVIRNLYLRWLYEARNNAVEVCIELEQAKKICGKNNYPLSSFLERTRTIGVNSVIIQEESFDSIRKNAKVAYFSNEDVVKNELLGIIGTGASLAQDTLVVNNQKLAGYLKSVIKAKTGIEPKENRIGNAAIFQLNRYLTDIGWGYLPENVEMARNAGFQVVYKPIKDFWIEETAPDNFSAIILSGLPDKQSVAALKISGAKIAIIESSSEESQYRKMFMPVAENIFRMHRIEQERLQRVFPFYSVEKLEVFKDRWLRAIKERNCRMLYFDFIEYLPLEENFNYLRDTCLLIRKSGFLLGQARKPETPAPAALPENLSKFLVLITAVIAPALAAYFIRRKTVTGIAGLKGVLKIFFSASGITIAGALLIASLLSGTVFSVKLDEFNGVRSAIALPLIVSIFIIFKYDKIAKFMKTPLSPRAFVVLMIAAALSYLLIQRIGNVGEIPSQESSVRAALENIFLIRPRFKEFLIGHPLMILGIALNSAPLIFIGMIGQVSIINTFIHAHTPLSISITRTIYGLLVGGLLGVILVFAAGFLRGKPLNGCAGTDNG